MDHQQVRAWIGHYGEGIDSRADELNRLDAALGDGDFGASMQRGMRAGAELLARTQFDSIGGMLRVFGSTLVSAMGGTSGPLVGTLFLRMGMAIGDSNSLDVVGLAAALRSGAEGVMALGQASPGDKTMLDSLIPGVEALEGVGDIAISEAVASVALLVREAAEATSQMVARRGRASYVGGGGVGHVDPGAMGMSILFEALNLAINPIEPDHQ